MTGSTRDRVVPVVLSLLFHGGLVTLLLVGWWQWRTHRPPPAPQTLAIEATVVTELPPAAAEPAPVPAPAPEAVPVAEPVPVPKVEPEPAPKVEPKPAVKPEPDKASDRKAAQAKAEAAAAEAKAERTRAAREKAEREAAARDKEARDKEARDKAAKEQAAREAADRQRKDAQRREQQLRVAEAEMRASLEAEARQTAARLSSAKAAYIAMIRERIQRAWIKPPGARAGLDCVVKVTQVPGGAVTGVNIGACNGDEAVKGSIEAAVYRASPLPEPADAAVFDRDLVFNFRPNE